MTPSKKGLLRPIRGISIEPNSTTGSIPCGSGGSCGTGIGTGRAIEVVALTVILTDVVKVVLAIAGRVGADSLVKISGSAASVLPPQPTTSTKQVPGTTD